ncbi:MAG: two-component regulator propeller domain-containing protein [Niabella sp.]
MSLRIIKNIFSLLAFLLLQITANAESYYFRNYSVESGLSNNCITSIVQDKAGFMWFGTKDGLNRFDGRSFKIFRKITGEQRSLGNNYIHTLFLDKAGKLWVGTEKGLYLYDEETEGFNLLPATANRYIDKITEDRNGNLWFISGNELCRYNRQSMKITYYPPDTYFPAANLCTTPDGTFWVGTIGGKLRQYHPGNDSFSVMDLFARSQPNTHQWIESLYPTKEGTLIAGTSGNQVKIIDPAQRSYTDITLPHTGEKDLFIRTIGQKSKDELWLGTEAGIYIYNIRTRQSTHLSKKYNDPYSVNDNAIYAIYKDREGGMWIGTYFGGISYLPKHYTPFTKYYPLQTPGSIAGNVVREITKDRLGYLWIGTEDAGLNKLDLATGQFTSYQPQNSPLSFFNIHGLLATGNELWIGTFHHGIDVMDIRTGKLIRHFNADGQSGLSHNFVYFFYRSSSGSLLAGTVNRIHTFDRKTNRFHPLKGFPENVWYTSIHEDKKGTFWATSFGSGIIYHNPASGMGGNYVHNDKDPHSLSNNRVNAVFEDSRENLWFATEDGLCRLDQPSGRFTRYGTANGFPSDFILNLLEDDQGRLWISTTKGLVCFDYTSGKTEVYTADNGLLSNQFNYSSAFKDSDGRMYFGSARGLISFQPEAFDNNPFLPPVHLTSFFVNGKEALVGDSRSPLKKSVNYTKEIRLQHDQSTFSIDFGAPGFTAPETLQYTYQMEGLSENWVNLKTSKRVDFIGLAPGTYTFRIKAFINDNLQGDITTLKIIISPPWWAGKPAYTLYTLTAFGLIFFALRYGHKRVEEKNNRKIAMLKVANEKKMLEMELAKGKEMLAEKLDFFTNVAHEIKTPLTLIKVPLARIMRKTEHAPDIQNSLGIIRRNTDRLIELTHQLLDFRRTETHKYRLSFTYADIPALVSAACTDFASLAESKGIQFNSELPREPFFADVDTDAFNKIICNLLSNAIKYAASKVQVYVVPPLNNKLYFIIEVKNDGYKIPDHLKEKIFEAFYRIEETNTQAGTGLGLALSRSLTTLHGGTLTLKPYEGKMNIFCLTLPVKDSGKGTVQPIFFDENKDL